MSTFWRLTRRPLLLIVLSSLVLPLGPGRSDAPAAQTRNRGAAVSERKEKIVKPDREWRAQLTREQYRVTRKKGTERAFTGEYWNTKTPGTYVCVCCDQPLYSSQTKYDSGTGWPSYWAPVDRESVEFKVDRSFFTVRTEVVCSRCDAHLGHVFNDGPPPTGMRHCINSAALKLVEEGAQGDVPASQRGESRDR